MRWVGLDLHTRYITACALDDAGQIVAEHRRLPPDAPALVAWLQGLGDAVTVAMEATLYWAWLHDQLSAAGIAAVAAHPYQVKLIWQARCKTDPIDARKLADLLRTNLLPAIWVPDPEVRARRKRLRGRAYLVRLRTSVKNRIHGHLTAENCGTAVTDLYGRAGRAWLRTVDLSPMGRPQVDLLLEVVDALDERIGRLDDRVKHLVKDDPVAQRLQTWPGNRDLRGGAVARGDRRDRSLSFKP
jgi:transposase